MDIKGRILEYLSATGRNISISKMERDLELSNGTINHWDQHNPSLDNLIKVSDYLNCSVDYLLSRDKRKQPQIINFNDFLVMNRQRYQLSISEEKALYSVVGTYLNTKERV